MKMKSVLATTVALGVAAALVFAVAPTENTVPNVITTAGDVTVSLGATTFVNHGLQGVGRISASALDSFGESFGSVSSLQVTDWRRRHDGSYTGTFNILPDRGYNNGDYYADYAARINTVGFRFVPYTGSTNIGGVTDLQQLQAQDQITFTTAIDGVEFKYWDPNTHTWTVTTGLDPGSSSTSLFGKTMPYVTTFTGPATPGMNGITPYSTYAIGKLPLDSEALIIKADGSGYVGDEYGANVYYFNEHKHIVGAIVPPPAFQPHLPAGILNFTSIAVTSAPFPTGRRANQGFEGVSLSPSGTRLFVLLQSATVQDSNPAANDQLAKNTRLLVYDVSGSPTPSAPIAEYALVLPTYKANGNGGAVNKTAAQSEVVALDNTRFLVLSRDGNGLGNSSTNPSVFKSFLLVDTNVGSPTNFAGDATRNAEGGRITTAPGVLDPLITPLNWVEAVNMLNSTQLSKFNVRLDTGTGQVSKLTLGEKWEGATLVPAHDPANPNDYFLFVGNDNDFLTSNGLMRGPNGVISGYNGFNGYPATRLPAPLDSAYNENDTVILAFRVTITSADPDGQMFGAGRIGDSHFEFRTRQTHNQDYGRLEYWIRDPRHPGDDDDRCLGDKDGDYGRDHGWTLGHFEASSITSVVFSDNPGFTPGRGPKPTVDTAHFTGSGRWNGHAGYTFDATATDQGEPGRHRDTFSLVIKDPSGTVVSSVSGTLDDGNIQSARLFRDR